MICCRSRSLLSPLYPRRPLCRLLRPCSWTTSSSAAPARPSQSLRTRQRPQLQGRTIPRQARRCSRCHRSLPRSQQSHLLRMSRALAYRERVSAGLRRQQWQLTPHLTAAFSPFDEIQTSQVESDSDVGTATSQKRDSVDDSDLMEPISAPLSIADDAQAATSQLHDEAHASSRGTFQDTLQTNEHRGSHDLSSDPAVSPSSLASVSTEEEEIPSVEGFSGDIGGAAPTSVFDESKSSSPVTGVTSEITCVRLTPVYEMQHEEVVNSHGSEDVNSITDCATTAHESRNHEESVTTGDEYDDSASGDSSSVLQTPSSVVSSPGSSVAGSAFTFISGAGALLPSTEAAHSSTSLSPLSSEKLDTPGNLSEAEDSTGDTTVQFKQEMSAVHEPEETLCEFGSVEASHNDWSIDVDDADLSRSTSEQAVTSSISTEQDTSSEALKPRTADDNYSDFDEQRLTDNPGELSESIRSSPQNTISAGENGQFNGFTSLAPTTQVGHDDIDSSGGFSPSNTPQNFSGSACADTDFGELNQSFTESPMDRSAFKADDDFGGFSSSMTKTTADDDAYRSRDDSFGGFSSSFSPSIAEAAGPSAGSDALGGFSQFGSAPVTGDGEEFDDFAGTSGWTSAITTSGDMEADGSDDDFGDFGTASTWNTATSTKNENDDFDDFTPPSNGQDWPTPLNSGDTSTTPSWSEQNDTPSISIPSDLDKFFSDAFPASRDTVSTSVLQKPATSQGGSLPNIPVTAIFEQGAGDALRKSFLASLEVYRATLAGELDDQQQQQPEFESEALRLKYLKYVLTEKMSEASRHDGVFPHGSEKYHLYLSISESSNEKNMREALSNLQEALFHSSVNEAFMRIARQAALSAKARIAEQAAQQQAHARGSLLATTRQFLSRGVGSGADSSSRTGSSGNLGVLTPTGTSAQKNARAAFQGGQEGELGNSSGYGSGEDTGSDASVGEASSHSESDFTSTSHAPSAPSSSSNRGGSLMKKFQERLNPFSSSKHRSRVVQLRRMGQSNEDVRKMELQMDSINGGFDEVKWKCAVFLHESEEVTQLAPSQIKIYSYPSNQLLTGKTDRSILSKFFKPGTIWSIDIGADRRNSVSME